MNNTSNQKSAMIDNHALDQVENKGVSCVNSVVNYSRRRSVPSHQLQLLRLPLFAVIILLSCVDLER